MDLIKKRTGSGNGGGSGISCRSSRHRHRLRPESGASNSDRGQQKSGLDESLLGFDVVANCTPYHFGLIVTGAINVRVSSLDLGGLYNTPSSLL